MKEDERQARAYLAERAASGQSVPSRARLQLPVPARPFNPVVSRVLALLLMVLAVALGFFLGGHP